MNMCKHVDIENKIFFRKPFKLMVQSILLYRDLNAFLPLATHINLYLCVWQIFWIWILKPHQYFFLRWKTSWDFSIFFPSRENFALLPVFVLNILNWNLPEFDFNEFILNHCKARPESNLRLRNVSNKSFPHKCIVLLSVKLHISVFETKRNISFTNMLNNKGLTVDPCIMPQVTFHQSLKRKPFLYFLSHYWVI